MTTTRDFLRRRGYTCAYCGSIATQRDHLIPKNAARRRPRAAAERENEKYQVPTCHGCNIAKGSLLRVPTKLAHLIPELEEITGSVFGTFDGTAADLRRVLL